MTSTEPRSGSEQKVDDALAVCGLATEQDLGHRCIRQHDEPKQAHICYCGYYWIGERE